MSIHISFSWLNVQVQPDSTGTTLSKAWLPVLHRLQTMSQIKLFPPSVAFVKYYAIAWET